MSFMYFSVSSLSGREQLLHSFGKTSNPENIGTTTATDSLDSKLHKVRKTAFCVNLCT